MRRGGRKNEKKKLADERKWERRGENRGDDKQGEQRRGRGAEQ